MNTAKENILKKLSRNQGHKSTSAFMFKDKGNEKEEEEISSDDTHGLVLFISKLKQNRIEVYQTPTQDWSECLLQVIKEKKITTCLLGKGNSIQESASTVLSKCSKDTEVIYYNEAYEGMKNKLFHHAQASVTSAKAAIVDTGTLLLIPDQAEPRMMSLTPEINIIVLHQSNLFSSFHQLVKTQLWDKNNLPSNIVFISSPSKTADIQQTLAYGAHGPKEVIVILVEDNN